MKSLLDLLDYQSGDYVTTPNEKHIWRIVDVYPNSNQVCLRLYKMKDPQGVWRRYDNLETIRCETDGLVLYMSDLP